ncbi:MAG: hypothetical protein Q4A19_05910 [Johnsonella sp.]|nr:hypothetical protein [Johnsonella sp.]
MRKINFKRQLAALLSAGMVFTMLAPAQPVYADTIPDGTPGKVNFSLSKWQPSVGPTGDFSINGTAGADLTGHGEADTRPGFENKFLLPYLKVQGTEVEYTPNLTFAGKEFPGSDFVGYKIAGWYTDKTNQGIGFQAHHLPSQWPYAETTYYAELEADPAFEFKMETIHRANAASGVTVPNMGTESVLSRVLSNFQATPRNIPGFKVINVDDNNNGDGGKTITSFKYEASHPMNVEQPLPTPDNFAFNPATKYVTGTVSNRDMRVEYVYDVDTSVQFSLKVEHDIAGLKQNESREYNAGISLNAENIGPKENLLQPQGTDTQPRYLLVDKKITLPDGSPVPGGGAQAPNLLGGESLSFNPANNKLEGTMLNRNVKITYVYDRNPNYTATMRIKYQDALGNNITDKVIAKLAQTNPGLVHDGPASAGSTNPFKEMVGSEQMLTYTVKFADAANYVIYAPVLDDYLSDPLNGPKVEAVDPADFAGAGYTLNATGWNAANPQYNVTIAAPPSGSGDLTVTYTLDPDRKVDVTLGSNGNGRIMVGNVEYDLANNSSHAITLLKENIDTVNNTCTVTIDESQLHTLVPDVGYKAVGWKYDNNFINLPVTLTLPRDAQNIYLEGIFEEEAGDWNEYYLAAGNAQVSITGPTIVRKLNKDVHGNPLTITWADLSAETANISLVPNHSAKWYDENSQLMDPASPVAAGMTYTVYGVSDLLPPGPYTPTASASLDPATAKPVITLDTSADPIHPGLDYVITDMNGNVIDVIPGSQVLANGGSIISPNVHPGEAYQLFTANPGMAVPGQPIPPTGTDVSSPAQLNVPHILTPQVTEDSANPGRASIIIDPTTPDHEYALMDSNGNVVYPFAAPSPNGGPISFGDLDPDATYSVVVRPVGSPATEADQAPGQPVNTDNLGLAVTAFKVSTVFPAGASLELALSGIGGNPISDLSELDAIAPGTRVDLEASNTDANSNFFDQWMIISGISASDANFAGNKISFTMPRNPVKLQALYESVPATWSNALYDNNKGDGLGIAVVRPTVTPNATTQPKDHFRIHIVKDPMSSAIRDLIAAEESDPFKGLWVMRAVLQYEDASGNWIDYPEGIPELDVTIETGALISTQEYRFYKVDPANLIAHRESGSFENDWTSNQYQGEFDFSVENGAYYAFGYVKPTTYTVKIKDSRTGAQKVTFLIRSDEALSDHSAKYDPFIEADEIDANGITWTYKGLSSDRDNFVPVDTNLRLTDNMTLYLFYGNDRQERADADRELRDLIASAMRRMNDPIGLSDKRKLQQAIDLANAILNQTSPRKASTPELLAEIAKLGQVLRGVQDIDSSGGGSGGSGGGGSASRGIDTNRSLRVGQDGDWKLVDAANHKWEFNLKQGGKVKGWASLSYTFQGKTKVEWYHFGDDNIMDSGWLFDQTSGKWYYLSEDHDGFFGQMVTGWYRDANDGKWYYLDPNKGAMLLGWQNIGGLWYYFAPANNAQTWFYNEGTRMWEFKGSVERPYGSMYINEKTPDGYTVNAEGVWVQ